VRFAPRRFRGSAAVSLKPIRFRCLAAQGSSGSRRSPDHPMPLPMNTLPRLCVLASVPPHFTTQAHAVAVRNVTAWPNLTPLADGSIIASIFNQPSHGFWEGDVDCWGTVDGGASWQLRGTPAPHEPTTNRMNVAAGTNAKGELIVLAAGWSHRPLPPPEGTPRRFDPPAAILPIWVCRSTDGGRTWTRTQGVALSDHLIPFGDIIQLGNGRLGVCLYAPKSLGVPNSNHEHASYFFSSADDGLTWTLAGVIASQDVNETTPLLLLDGSLLACGRTTRGRHLELFRSADHGATWKKPRVQSPPPANIRRISRHWRTDASCSPMAIAQELSRVQSGPRGHPARPRFRTASRCGSAPMRVGRGARPSGSRPSTGTAATRPPCN